MNDFQSTMKGCRVVVPSARRGLTLVQLLLTIAVIALAIALLLPARRGGREAGRRSQCRHNLKQIGLALHNYHETYGSFPPACTVDEAGRPLHSWRTLLLPFLDANHLSQQIDFSKPWDDPVNLKVGKERVDGFHCPSADIPTSHTTYLAVATSSSLLRVGESSRLKEITDNPATTLMVVEVAAGHAVPWMSPHDADEALLLSLGSQSKLPHSVGIHVLNVDGSVGTLAADAPAAERRARISVAGKD